MSITLFASTSTNDQRVLTKSQRDTDPNQYKDKAKLLFSLASMDGISSTPIENSVQFLRLRDKYKSNLLDDSRLTKAADLAAQKELLLESPATDTWKEPRLKSVNRELQQWVKKIRQPGGTQGISRDEDDSDDENLAVGPLQHFMGNISKISKAIKRKAEPVTPQSVLQDSVT